MRYLLMLPLFFFSSQVFSQVPDGKPSSEIFQQIKKLNVLGSVLYIAAHPDDENTQLLAWLSNDKLYRTAYLSMTRGDGGQNLIGDEQGVELGLIRTKELLAARKIDGAEQFFTRAFDFGYSKGPDETFQFWNKEKILSDVVWVIRKFRPDVLITRFPTTGEGGHGHHTASAILAGEAFDAAGDTTRFPEQFKYGVTTWRPRRLLWNTFNFGGNNTTAENQFKIDIGGYNPLLGKSYGEIAAESRSQHKSQGFGVSASRGVHYDYFKLIKGEPMQAGLLEDVNISWGRVGAENITALIADLEKNFSFKQPEKSVPALIAIYKEILKLPEGVWKVKKLAEVKGIIAECAGLFAEAYTTAQFLVPGEEMKLNVSVNNRLGAEMKLAEINFRNNSWQVGQLLPKEVDWLKEYNCLLPDTTAISQPYWLAYPMTTGSFMVKNQLLIGKPENDPMSISVTFNIEGIPIAFDVPVRYKFNDPVKGEVHQPVFVVPRVEIKSIPSLGLSINKSPVEIQTIISQNDPHIKVKDTRMTSIMPVQEISKDDKKMYFLKSDKNETALLDFHAVTDQGDFDRYKVMISYPHISDIVYFPLAESKLVSVEMKTAGREAGYVPGAGDKIPEALEQMGYHVTILNENNILSQNLSRFDVIITGVRAYNIHAWLNNAYDSLMKYVNKGGVLLVQYNTNNNIGPVKAKIGPYPFTISRTRVTDEEAKVNFLDKSNVLLNYPNKIVEQDFAGWIQERSTYQATDFNGSYQGLFSMNDKGELPSDGSLIYSNYGKGRFVYSGLVFFRQLPAGVPGAFRLFANLIAKPR